MDNPTDAMAEVQYSKAHHIEFQCVGCGNPVAFSILQVDAAGRLACATCGKGYGFTSELLDKVRLFERLLAAVYDARDLLGSANVGIAFRDEEVKVPYRLLLTRLNSLLTLNIGEKETVFRFRVEPLTMLSERDTTAGTA